MDKTVMRPAVSIIMPVYNAAVTVGRMIDSIIAQTFKDWELVAIDDGSTDASGEVLDNYAIADSRIKVIHKSNGGVASARQAGMEAAQGIYTIHADSDDWIEPSMLEDMLQKALSEDADIVIADYFTDSQKLRSQYIVQQPKYTEPLEVLKALYAKDLFGGLWHKLIKKSVYAKAQAQFIPGINYCEDLLVLTKIIANSNPNIVYLPKAYYHYVVNPNSLTQRVSQQGLNSMKQFHLEVANILQNHDEFINIKDEFAANEFIVVFTNHLYKDKSELKKIYSTIEPIISRHSYGIRWKLGFLCVKYGLIWLAHKLIRF